VRTKFVITVVICFIFGSPAWVFAGSVLSADDFKNTVKSMGKQSTDQLSSRLDQKLSKKLPPPVSTPPAAADTSQDMQSQEETALQSTQPTNVPADSSYYTGFESKPSKPSTTSKTAPAKNTNSGGWNINY